MCKIIQKLQPTCTSASIWTLIVRFVVLLFTVGGGSGMSGDLVFGKAPGHCIPKLHGLNVNAGPFSLS